jgi:small subunit ribosomal protein S14
MAKMALIERELKRDKLVAKYAKKHAELKAMRQRRQAQRRRACSGPPGLAEASPQREPDPSAQPLRDHRSSRGTFRQFGLAGAKIREMAFAGDIPGVTKASW